MPVHSNCLLSKCTTRQNIYYVKWLLKETWTWSKFYLTEISRQILLGKVGLYIWQWVIFTFEKTPEIRLKMPQSTWHFNFKDVIKVVKLYCAILQGNSNMTKIDSSLYLLMADNHSGTQHKHGTLNRMESCIENIFNPSGSLHTFYCDGIFYNSNHVYIYASSPNPPYQLHRSVC